MMRRESLIGGAAARWAFTLRVQTGRTMIGGDRNTNSGTGSLAGRERARYARSIRNGKPCSA